MPNGRKKEIRRCQGNGKEENQKNEDDRNEKTEVAKREGKEQLQRN